MRARLVRPEFWHDDKMADLPAATRLTYIGLWCISDDAGYFAWNPREIGADLYPHMSAGRRSKQVQTDLDRLVAAGRVTILSCERHAFIPTLERHRITGGKLSERVKHAHFKEGTDQSVPSGTPGTERYRSLSLSSSLSDSLSPSRRPGANGSTNQEKPTHISALLPKVVPA